MPTQKTIVFERFFDESGGMQLVIHSPFGSRINRAWGLALRKRFCRKFNFELQAAATEDAIVLSLSTSHSFPLDEVARYLHSKSVRPLLVQAMLDAPMFAARWRWTATTSLALPRFRSGKKVPPQLQRMAAEDLLAAVFPDQIACAENLVGEREVPDHPLVNQTVHDCLYEAMDIEGLETAARRDRIRRGSRRSPRPDGALAAGARDSERAALRLPRRRAAGGASHQAVMSRRWLDEETAAGLGRLDPEAIARVRAEAWPDAASADELHDALLGSAFVTEGEVASSDAMATLPRCAGGGEARHSSDGAPPASTRSATSETALWLAAERLPQFTSVFPDARHSPPIAAPAEFAARAWPPEDALVEIVRSRLEGLGPGHRRRARGFDGAAALRTSTPRWRSLLRKALRCAARSRRVQPMPNGATGRSSRASIAIPSTGCARRSSRYRRGISCVFFAAGSTSFPANGARVPTRWRH